MIITRTKEDRPLDGVGGKGRGYQPEHRRVLEAKIGRPLGRGEVCHHINGDRLDNRPENLMLLPSRSAHSKLHRILYSQVAVPVFCDTCLRKFIPTHSQRFCSPRCRFLSWAVDALAEALRKGDADGLRVRVEAMGGFTINVIHQLCDDGSRN